MWFFSNTFKPQGKIFGKIQAFCNVEILLFMETKPLGDE